jgi:Vitamin K-dependent gamma-carboxylase
MDPPDRGDPPPLSRSVTPSELIRDRVDPRPLALTRIAVGCAAGVILLFEYRKLLRALTDPDRLSWPTVTWLPEPTTALVGALGAAWLVAALALAAGIAGRLAAGALAAVGVLVLTLDEQLYSNHLVLMTAMAGLLSLARPSAAWSVDARLRRHRPEPIPYWPIFLLQVQVSTVYLFAALSKLNPSYLSGEVLAKEMRPFRGGSFDAVGDPFVLAVAVGALALEAFLAVGLWHTRLQRVAVPLGIVMHLSIAVLLAPPSRLISPVLAAFGLLAVAAYPLFLQSPWLVGSRSSIAAPRRDSAYPPLRS